MRPYTTPIHATGEALPTTEGGPSPDKRLPTHHAASITCGSRSSYDQHDHGASYDHGEHELDHDDHGTSDDDEIS